MKERLPGWKANFEKYEDFIPQAALLSLIRISFRKSLNVAAGRTRRENYQMPNLPVAALTAGIALQVCDSETQHRLKRTAKQWEV